VARRGDFSITAEKTAMTGFLFVAASVANQADCLRSLTYFNPARCLSTLKGVRSDVSKGSMLTISLRIAAAAPHLF